MVLNDRELATVIWLAIGSVFALRHNSIRRSAARVLASLLAPKVLAPIVLFGAYVAAVVWGAAQFGLWVPSLAKDTGVWFVFAGAALLIGIVTSPEDQYLRRTVLATIGATAVLEFYVNIVVFPLWFELLLQPAVAAVAAMTAVATVRSEYRSVKRALELVLATTALAIVASATCQLARERESIDLLELARGFALPFWLTVAVLPFIYGFGLVVSYETAFMRVRWAGPSRRLTWQSRFALLVGINLGLAEVRSFGGAWLQRLVDARTLHQALTVVRDYRAEHRAIRQRERRRKHDLRRFAGAPGVDGAGEPLDRREFRETKRALEWLAVVQVARYQRTGRYDRTVLDLVNFTSEGLPEQHGITLRVRRDGKAWYAWRKTVAGWYFAIGANSPPPNEWTRQAFIPPVSFPRAEAGWSPGVWQTEDDR